MPVSKLSLKVLDELDVDTCSSREKKIDIAISSRAQYLVSLKGHEELYLSNLQKLLAYAQTSLNLSKNQGLIHAIQNIIACHVDLFKILSLYINPQNNFIKPLQEIYCFRDISQWCLKFNRHYIGYCQHYNYNPFLPEFTSNLIKLPFIRYKALVKLLTKFYQLSLHFENSLPDFEFQDMTLRFMFVEITKNFQRSAKFASVQWNVIKDYLNNEKLYLDYFSIDFSMTRDIVTLEKTSESNFNINNILKRDYFEFEFHHPMEQTNNKKIIELVLLSDKKVNDYSKIHKSHTSKSLDKLSTLESKEDILSATNGEIIDSVFNSIINDTDDERNIHAKSHNREISDLSMIPTDAVEESYKGSLDFKFGEISGLAVCAVDSHIGRNLIFPVFARNSLYIKSINKQINEITLWHVNTSQSLICVKISCLDDEQFNNWVPFWKVLFPYYTDKTQFFEHHNLLKNKIEFKNALGIDLSPSNSLNDQETTVGSTAAAYRGETPAVAPLNLSKKSASSPIGNVSLLLAHHRISSRAGIEIPELDQFLKQLENNTSGSPATSDNFHFDEVQHESSNNNKESSLMERTSSIASKASKISKSQKINNFDVVLKEDNESDWTSITSSTVSTTVSPKAVQSYCNDSISRPAYTTVSTRPGTNHKNFINSKCANLSTSTGSVSIGEFRYLKMPASHSQISNKISSEQIKEESVPATKPPVPSGIVSAFRTPGIFAFGGKEGESTNDATSPRSLSDNSLSLTQAAEALTREFSRPLQLAKDNIEDSAKLLDAAETNDENSITEKSIPATRPSKKLSTAPLLRKLFGRVGNSKKSKNKRQSVLKPIDISQTDLYDSLLESSPVAASPVKNVKTTDAADLISPSSIIVDQTVSPIREIEMPVSIKKKVTDSSPLQISPSQKRFSSYQNSMKRRSHAKGNEGFSVCKSSAGKPSIPKSASRNSCKNSGGYATVNSNKRISSGFQMEIAKQQKLFNDLLGNSTPYSQSSQSPDGSKYNIPNNYSVSALTSPVTLNDQQSSNFALQTPIKVSAAINKASSLLASPKKLNFGKLQPDKHSSSENSFLSHSTSVSNTSFATGLTHQEPSNNDLNVILEDDLANGNETGNDSNEVSEIEKLDPADHESERAVVSDDDDIPVPKEEFLKEEMKLDSSASSDKFNADSQNKDSASSESDNDNEPITTSNVTYLNNFGKSFEPKFYSPEKKNRISRLSTKLSLKKKKSVDFEMVTKKFAKSTIEEEDESAADSVPKSNSASADARENIPVGKTLRSFENLLSNNGSKSALSGANVQRPNSTYTSKSVITNFSVLSSLNNSSKETITRSKETITSSDLLGVKHKSSFGALKKMASPLPGAFGRDKNTKSLRINTTLDPARNPNPFVASSDVSGEISASSSTSSFSSISEQYVANIDNCIIVHKDFVFVSYWKLDRWSSISNEPLYVEIAVSVDQSYLCFYKGDSLKSLSSIKPFLTLPINSSSSVTRNANNLDVQVKTFNELTGKTSLICMRSKNLQTSNTLMQAVEYAQRDQTKNSLMKTRQQLSNNSSGSLFYNGSLSSGLSNKAGDVSISDSASSTSAPSSESSVGNIKGLGIDFKSFDAIGTIPGSFSFGTPPPPLSAKSNFSFTNSLSSPISQTSSQYLAQQAPFAPGMNGKGNNNDSILSLNSQVKSLNLNSSSTDQNGEKLVAVRKIRLHKKSSISGKWNPLAISKLHMSETGKKSKLKVVINEYKTDKIIIDAVIDGSTASRIGRTGVCVIVQSKDGTTITNRPNYLLESRNEVEADELLSLLKGEAQT